MLWDCMHVTVTAKQQIEREGDGGEREEWGLILDAWHVELR